MIWTTHYAWWVVGLALIGAEILLPGFFLLWIGVAAAAMGIIVWLVPDMGVILQSVLFAALALASCLAYWKLLLPRQPRPPHGSNHLNRRAEQLIGRRCVLESAIVNGRGKAHVGDSQWLVDGPDLPVGASVEVVGVHGAMLKVRPAP
ncbi:MAG: NfeD family protein [Tahibacter sp.]